MLGEGGDTSRVGNVKSVKPDRGQTSVRLKGLGLAQRFIRLQTRNGVFPRLLISRGKVNEQWAAVER